MTLREAGLLASRWIRPQIAPLATMCDIPVLPQRWPATVQAGLPSGVAESSSMGA